LNEKTRRCNKAATSTQSDMAACQEGPTVQGKKQRYSTCRRKPRGPSERKRSKQEARVSEQTRLACRTNTICQGASNCWFVSGLLFLSKMDSLRKEHSKPMQTYIAQTVDICENNAKVGNDQCAKIPPAFLTQYKKLHPVSKDTDAAKITSSGGDSLAFVLSAFLVSKIPFYFMYNYAHHPSTWKEVGMEGIPSVSVRNALHGLQHIGRAAGASRNFGVRQKAMEAYNTANENDPIALLESPKLDKYDLEWVSGIIQAIRKAVEKQRQRRYILVNLELTAEVEKAKWKKLENKNDQMTEAGMIYSKFQKIMAKLREEVPEMVGGMVVIQAERSQDKAHAIMFSVCKPLNKPSYINYCNTWPRAPECARTLSSKNLKLKGRLIGKTDDLDKPYLKKYAGFQHVREVLILFDVQTQKA